MVSLNSYGRSELKRSLCGKKDKKRHGSQKSKHKVDVIALLARHPTTLHVSGQRVKEVIGLVVPRHNVRYYIKKPSGIDPCGF